jgi:hypothetical protein
MQERVKNQDGFSMKNAENDGGGDGISDGELCDLKGRN